MPFLLKPPRSRAQTQGRVSPALVELVDIAATLYDLAGIDPGYTYFGRSPLALAAGEATAHRDAVFCEGGAATARRTPWRAAPTNGPPAALRSWPSCGSAS